MLLQKTSAQDVVFLISKEGHLSRLDVRLNCESDKFITHTYSMRERGTHIQQQQ